MEIVHTDPECPVVKGTGGVLKETVDESEQLCGHCCGDVDKSNDGPILSNKLNKMDPDKCP